MNKKTFWWAVAVSAAVVLLWPKQVQQDEEIARIAREVARQRRMMNFRLERLESRYRAEMMAFLRSDR